MGMTGRYFPASTIFVCPGDGDNPMYVPPLCDSPKLLWTIVGSLPWVLIEKQIHCNAIGKFIETVIQETVNN